MRGWISTRWFFFVCYFIIPFSKIHESLRCGEWVRATLTRTSTERQKKNKKEFFLPHYCCSNKLSGNFNEKLRIEWKEKKGKPFLMIYCIFFCWHFKLNSITIIILWNYADKWTSGYFRVVRRDFAKLQSSLSPLNSKKKRK